MKCTPSDSPLTLVSGKVRVVEKFARVTPKKVPNEGGLGFFGDFRPICRHISKMVHFRHKVTMGR